MICRSALALLLLSACATSPQTPVEQALAEHRGEFREREIVAGVLVHCSPPEAEVLVDGILQGHCRDLGGHVLSLAEGLHRVQVARSGMQPYEARVEAGKARTVLRVQLEPSNQAP